MENDSILRLLEAHEAERSMFGRRLHDGLAQRFAAAGFASECLLQKLEHAEHIDDGLRTAASDLVALMQEVAGEFSGVLAELNPATILEKGFTDAVSSSCTRIEKQFDVPCRFEPDGAVRLEHPLALHAFRAVEEVLDCATGQREISSILITTDTSHGSLKVTISIEGENGSTEREIKGSNRWLLRSRTSIFGGYLRASRTDTGSQISLVFPRTGHDWTATPPRSAAVPASV